MSIGNFVKRVRDIMRQDAGINGDAQRIEQLTWMLFLKVYDDAESVWELMDDEYESIIPEYLRWRHWANTDIGNTEALKGDELLDFVNNDLFPTLKDLQLPAHCPRRKSVVKAVFEDIHNYMKDGVQLHELMVLINEFDFSDPEETHAFGLIYESILRELQSAGSAGEYYTPRALTDFMAAHVGLKPGDMVADFACGTGGFLNSARRVLEPQAAAGTNEDRELLSHSFFGIEKKPLPYLLCVTNLLLNGIDEPNVRHANSLTTNVQEFGEKDKFDVILMNPPYGGSEKPVIQGELPGAVQEFRNRRPLHDADQLPVEEGRPCRGGHPRRVPLRLGREARHQGAPRHEVQHAYDRSPADERLAPYTSIATNVVFFDNTGPTKETWFYRVDMPEGYKHFSKTKPMLLEHLKELDAWWTDRKAITVDGFDKARG